jgi:hypothetical protein
MRLRMEKKGTMRGGSESGGREESTVTKLAKFTGGTSFEDFILELVEESKCLFLDSLACALAGKMVPYLA